MSPNYVQFYSQSIKNSNRIVKVGKAAEFTMLELLRIVIVVVRFLAALVEFDWSKLTETFSVSKALLRLVTDWSVTQFV